MDEQVIVKELLPYPFAHYSNTFIGFHKELGSEIVFCSCQKCAIENQLEMSRLCEDALNRKEPQLHFVTVWRDFPAALLKWRSILGAQPHRLLGRIIQYHDGLCHRCNLRVPYGHYGYSDSPSNFFVCHFRPYLNQAFYARGCNPSGHVVLPEKCPDELKSLTQLRRSAVIENSVREAFCFPEIGVKRNQESFLFFTVRELFPECEVIQHHRPEWLEGMELDIFVPGHNLGIEFQGVQHYEPMEHLGGTKALRQTQSRDKRKAKLCRKNGINLVQIDEGEDLSADNIARLLRAVMPNLRRVEPQVIEKPPFDFYLPVEGQRLRWTYHADKGDLSVSGSIGAVGFFMSGGDFSVAVTTLRGLVTNVRARIHQVSGSVDVSMPVATDGQQFVELHRGRKEMISFFKVWSMFDPRIRVVEEHDGEKGNRENVSITVFL